MREHAVDGVGHRRVDRAARRVAWSEHEVVDEQLGSPVEQLRERLLAVVGVEAVLLLDRDPGQLASLPGEVVADPGVLLFAHEKPIARGKPFFAWSDRMDGQLHGYGALPPF